MTRRGIGIQIEGVRRTYLGVQVLRDVSLTVEPGRLTVVRGPSGSGKTTLLNLVAALDQPDAGRITIGDVVVTDLRGRDRARFRAHVGMVFQRSGLIGGLTARQNVEAVHALNRQRLDPAWVDSVSRRLRISDVLDQPATQLSGGQAQRVALLRAIAHQPEVLFADEPTASLDEASKREVHDLLRALARESGTTVFMVSHDEMSPTYADELVTLVDGRLGERGSRNERSARRTRGRR